MKELLIIRHAKSSWADAQQDDFDRPLNERGRKDAPFMADELLKRNISLDLLITSNANRAYNTCLLFASRFPNAKLIVEPTLYQAPLRSFYEVVSGIDNSFQKVALFSHNTGLTDFVNAQCKVRVDIVPTCGIYGLKIDIEDWSQFKKAKKAFWFFDYPKNHMIR